MKYLWFFVLLGMFTQIAAAADPVADKLLDEAIARSQVLPAGFDIEMTSSGFGQEGDMAVRSSTVFKDVENLRLRAEISMIQGGQSMETTVIMVADGVNLWMEQIVPSQGAHMVGKAAAADFKNLSQGMSPEDFNPDRLLRAAKKLELTASGSDKDYSLLKGRVNQAFLSEIPGFETMTDVLDVPVEVKLHTKDSFPFSMTLVESETQKWTLTIKNVRELSPDELKAALQYTPPEGVQVIDMRQNR